MKQDEDKKNKRDFLGHLTDRERLFIDGLGDAISGDRKEVNEQWKEFFLPELKLFDLVCAMLVHFAEKLRRKKAISRFEEAFLILSSKMLSDAQCLKLNLENGWTGTAMGVSRMVWSVNTMIMFLAYYPEHVEDWFSEKYDSYQKDKKFKKLFSESNILKKITEKGFVDIKDAFHLQSKGVHASYWGSQVYTDEGYVTFHPRPDFFKTLVLLSETAGVISGLLGWYVRNLSKSFQEAFQVVEERTLFAQLNTKMGQACGHLLDRIHSYLADTQEEREKKMGEPLGKLDPVEWKKLSEEIAKKGDPPLEKLV